jgi:MFS family permease
MILLSRMQAPWQFYVCYGCLGGMGMSAAYVPCTATAVKWFRRRRGLAVSLTGVGASLGIAGIAPLSETLMAQYGWRQTYLLFGVVVSVVLNLLALFVVRDPETLGLQPDGDPPLMPRADTPVPAEAPDRAWTVQEARRTSAFWLLASVMVGAVLTIPAVYVHLPQYTSDLHLAVPRSRFVMLVGLGALLGNLTLGWCADRLGRHRALGLSLLLGTLALGGLTVARGIATLTVASAGFGVYYGTFVSLFPAVMSDFFGRQHAGTLTGVSFALGSVAAALGPVLMGWVADRTGQYALAFLGGTIVNGLIVLLCVLARPPVRHPQPGPGSMECRPRP